MLDVLLPTCLLVVLGYALHSAVNRSVAGGRSKSELPIHRRASTSPSSPWTVERSGLTISLATSGLNGIASHLMEGRSRLRRVLLAVYNLGSVLGLIGGAGSVGVTAWTVGQVWNAVWHEARSHAAQKGDIVRVLKRTISETSDAQPSAGLQPLIPGVTLPWSHLPTLVLALIVNQLIHEAGHALSAALEEVTMSSFSLNLHFVLPSMAVHLPASVDRLPARARMRLASSGPLHNLVIFGWLWVLAFSGSGDLLWTDMGDMGRVVDSVAAASPLAYHISPGRVVTHLDDVPLADDIDIWTEYLNSDHAGDEGRGWCFEEASFDALPGAPCEPTSGKIAFESGTASASSQIKCLDPTPILYTPSERCPCANAQYTCIRPIDAERILRIRLEDGSSNGEVVLWQGDRRAVLSDVKVGRRGARFLGPFVRWAAMFNNYLSTIALSLFLFNLLPLPHTDGSQLLQALLSSAPQPSTFSLRRNSRARPLTSSRRATRTLKAKINIRHAPAQQYEYDSDDEYGYGLDVEDGRGEREQAWKRRLRRGAEGSVMGLAGLWVAGWAMLMLLRSS